MITTDTYADDVVANLPVVNKLIDMGDEGCAYAFNLMMSIADHSHTDLDTTFKMSGYGESEGPFKGMAECLLGLIESRKATDPSKAAAPLPEVSKRWKRKDAYEVVGDFKTGRPNKQQRNQMVAHKLKWESERRHERRGRREGCANWVAVALVDLKEERDYLDGYMIDAGGYFVRVLLHWRRWLPRRLEPSLER